MFDTIELTEEECLIRQTVREFATNELRPEAESIDREEVFPRHAFDAALALGVAGTAVPEVAGGSGGTTNAFLLALEEIARIQPGLALALGSHSLAVRSILVAGDTDQKGSLVAPLVDGKLLGAAIAPWLTEPAHARPMRDGWVIEGSVPWVVGGSVADLLVVPARLDAGLVLFAVRGRTKGLRASPLREKVGMRGADLAATTFSDLWCGQADLLGGGPLHPASVQKLRSFADAVLAAIGLGLGEAATEIAARYAQERVQFGRPIGSFAATRTKLARMVVSIEAARGLLHQTARLLDRDAEAGPAATAALCLARDAAHVAAKESIQIHGGNGYTADYAAERHYRDAQILLSGFDGGNSRPLEELGGWVLERCQ